jgi:hypothetical protein
MAPVAFGSNANVRSRDLSLCISSSFVPHAPPRRR